MKVKELISNFKFCKELVNVFNVYVKCLEEYFNNQKNIEEHKELYEYYRQLDINIKNVAIRNGILKDE